MSEELGEAHAQKWACEYCTYENYPSAIKCTMCRAMRLTQIIDPTPKQGPEVIYHLQVNSETEELGGCTAGIEGKLWSCSECTYLNEWKLQQCLQCLAARASSAGMASAAAAATHMTANSLHEHLIPLNLADDSSSASCKEQRSGSKWICRRCTYQNWPRSGHCIMCGEKRSPSSLNSPDAACSNSDNRILRRHESSPTDITVNNNAEAERRRRQARQQQAADWPWLDACLGVVQGDPNPVEAYLASGGDPTRQLTAAEVHLLHRPSAFDVGHTLVHLAIRFHREDLLATLLSQIEGSGAGVKRVPSYVAPDLAADIQRHLAAIVRQRKGTNFPCYYVTEVATFAIPAEVEDLPAAIQEQLYEELLDRDAQAQLETDPPALNWSLEITVRLGSRLFALWNRSAGDCLLDSAMQASWGVFDRDNTLRRALSESLHQGSHVFYPRWKEYESLQASLMHFSLDEGQWEEDWAGLLSLASQPGSSLQQLHVFALAHVLRRPIIVYGVKYVKSFRGETLGFARFEGVYLPLLWESTFCSKSPIALGYTRGHFSALVPMEPYMSPPSRPSLPGTDDDLQVTFLPLQSHDRKLLPVHFLTQAEAGCEETLLRQWLDVCATEGGLLVAQQRLDKRPLLVAQMVEEWLNHYRRLAQTAAAPFSRPVPSQDYSSDGDSDDE